MITLHRCEGRLILLMMIGWGWVAEWAGRSLFLNKQRRRHHYSW